MSEEKELRMDWTWCFEEPRLAAELIDMLENDRNRYCEALERIAKETIEPRYCYDIAMRIRNVAREALREVLGE